MKYNIVRQKKEFFNNYCNFVWYRDLDLLSLVQALKIFTFENFKCKGTTVPFASARTGNRSKCQCTSSLAVRSWEGAKKERTVKYRARIDEGVSLHSSFQKGDTPSFIFKACMKNWILSMALQFLIHALSNR